MIEKPEITKVEQDDNTVVLTLSIPADLSYFPGHFAEHPILPGVVQLRWADELARKYGLASQPFVSVDKLKFQRIIAPEYEVKLELKKVSDKTVQFRYESVHGPHSSGRINFSS